MNTGILNPIELWQGFSLFGYKSKTNVLSRKCYNGFIIYTMYVSGSQSDRIFVKLAIPDGKKEVPLFLYVNDIQYLLTDDELIGLSNGRYAVATFDYVGEKSIDGKHTIYASGESFEKYKNNLYLLNTCPEDVRLSPWHIWSKTARYIITALLDFPSIKEDGFVIGGLSRGSLIAMQVASIDKRCSGLVVLRGYGNAPMENTSKTDGKLTEEDERWLSAFSMEATAKFIDIPSLFVMTTNSKYVHCEKLQPLLNGMQSDKIYISLSERCNFNIYENNYNAVKLFLNGISGEENTLKIVDEPNAEVVDGKITFISNIDYDLKQANLFYSQGKEAVYRTWNRVQLIKKENNEYSASIRVGDLYDEMYYFTSVEVDDYTVTSTIKLIELPHKEFEEGKNRILYDSSKKEGTFTVESESLIIPNGDIFIEKGAFDIDGIGGKENGLITYILADERFSPKENYLLSMDVFGSQEKEFTVIVYCQKDNTNVEQYRASFEYKPQATWGKAVFATEDFKNDSGIELKDWKGIKALKLNDIEGLLFNNILFV